MHKKERMMALHRENIMKAAQELFEKNVYDGTKISDISQKSGNSSRTIYGYYESKEYILYHIVETGLKSLKQDILDVISQNKDFVTGYRGIYSAMIKYHREFPASAFYVNGKSFADFDFENMTDTVKNIIKLGNEINEALSVFIKKGIESGAVRDDVIPMATVYILWSSVTSFISLVKTKGEFICRTLYFSESELLDYGFKQIINSILETRI